MKCFILELLPKQNVKIGFCNISIWKEPPFLSQQFSHKEYEMSSENLLHERWVYFTDHWKAVSFSKGSVEVLNGSGIHND